MDKTLGGWVFTVFFNAGLLVLFILMLPFLLYEYYTTKT